MGIEIEIWLEELLYTEYFTMTLDDYLKSPCIKVCKTKLTKDGTICTGCLRDLDQITNWSSYTNEEKEEQLKIIQQRKSK